MRSNNSVSKIKRYATNFRKAKDMALDNDEFINIQTFRNFPNDCCDLTCDLLAQYLSEHGIQTYQINGVCKMDEQWHHVWLVAEDGIVIDITSDQFINRLVSENEVNPVHVGSENIIHKLFCVNRTSEINTIFTDPNQFTDFDGQPNIRQKKLIKVYEIISKYL